MHVSEIACFTSNPDRTISFYERLLNRESPSKSREVAEFMLGQTKIFVHKTPQHEEGSDPKAGSDLPMGDHVAFAVVNLDDACKSLTAKGITVDIPPREYYWGRSAYLRDPDGRWLELHETPSP